MMQDDMNTTLLRIVFLSLFMTVGSRGQGVVTIIPDKPTLGDTISFIYNAAATGAKLRNKKLVSLNLQPMARPSVGSAFAYSRAYDMQFENGVWIKKLVLTDSTKPFFRYFFYSSMGSDSSEKDRRDEFQMLLHDRAGMPLPCAHLCRYYALADLKTPDVDSLRHNELLEELKFHPTNFRAHDVLWSEQLTKSANRSQMSATIRRTVDSVFERYPENLDALVGCANAYRELGDTVKAEMLEFRITTLFPLSSDAEILKFHKAFREKNPGRKITSLCELLRTFPNSEMASSAFDLIEDYYLSKKDSATPERIKAEWERIRSRDNNEPLFSLEDVRKSLQRSDLMEAPDFVIYDINGHKITRKGLSGKIVVLDFWATWCRPCMEALPQFQRFCEQYKTKGEITFLAINVKNSGDSLATVREFMKDNRYSFPVALDTSDVTNQFSITAIPTAIVIDSQGHIRFRTTGYLTADEYAAAIKTAVETLMQE